MRVVSYTTYNLSYLYCAMVTPYTEVPVTAGHVAIVGVRRARIVRAMRIVALTLLSSRTGLAMLSPCRTGAIAALRAAPRYSRLVHMSTPPARLVAELQVLPTPLGVEGDTYRCVHTLPL